MNLYEYKAWTAWSYAWYAGALEWQGLQILWKKSYIYLVTTQVSTMTHQTKNFQMSIILSVLTTVTHFFRWCSLRATFWNLFLHSMIQPAATGPHRSCDGLASKRVESRWIKELGRWAIFVDNQYCKRCNFCSIRFDMIMQLLTQWRSFYSPEFCVSEVKLNHSKNLSPLSSQTRPEWGHTSPKAPDHTRPKTEEREDAIRHTTLNLTKIHFPSSYTP